MNKGNNKVTMKCRCCGMKEKVVLPTNIGYNFSLINLLNLILLYYNKNQIFSNFDISILDLIFKKVSKNIIFINKSNKLSITDNPIFWMNY